MNKQNKKPRRDDMYEAILTLETVEECKRFFDDLCTVTELQAMEQRYQVAVYLSQGMIYNDILERTGASSTGPTDTRWPSSASRRPASSVLTSPRAQTPKRLPTRNERLRSAGPLV